MLIRLASTALAAGIVTTLLAATPIDAAGSTPRAATADRATVVVEEFDGVIQPRVAAQKVASADIVLPENPATREKLWNGRLVVKFLDQLKVRADAMPGRPVRASQPSAANAANDLAARLGGSIRPFFSKSPSTIRKFEVRAERKSGYASPDFAGMVYVDVAPERLLEAARAFNDLAQVEWVYIERDPRPCGQENLATQFGCGTNGPGDSSGINNCYTASASGFGIPPRCSAIAGGPGCNNPAGCTNPDGALPSCRYGCNDTACCATVTAIEPSCSSQESGRGWDALCATYANLLCTGTVYESGGVIQGGEESGTIAFAFPSPPNPSTASVPQVYAYDPCMALRAPPAAPGPVGPGGVDILIQGSIFTVDDLPDPAQNFGSQLLTYDLDPSTLNVIPGSVQRIPYNSVLEEGNPALGIVQLAKQDPSLEGINLGLAGNCFQPSGKRGCNQVTCCVAVCRLDPGCCGVLWDSGCADRAAQLSVVADAPCVSSSLPEAVFPRDPAAPTPLLTGGESSITAEQPGRARGFQLYTVGPAVAGEFQGLPSTPVPALNNPPALAAPTINNSDSTAADRRDDPSTNLGTLAFLNSMYRGGGLDMEDYADILEDLNIDAATQARGQNVRVAVVDRSAFVNHEDLQNRPIRFSPSQVIPDNSPCYVEPNQTQTLATAGVLNPNHGTGVLGIIGAGDNGFGVTGVSYGADLRFYPAVSREEGQRLQNAMLSALIDLREGDVLCVPMDLPGAEPANGLTLVSAEPYFQLVQTATAAGITVVLPAGNQGSPVVTSPANTQAVPDSGAVIVGGCWPGWQVGTLSAAPTPNGTSIPFSPLPGRNFCRWQTSNFSNTNDTGNGNTGVINRVFLSAWATGVVTTGFGGLWSGENEPVDTDLINGPLERNNLRTYSDLTDFTGTSPAAAIIAGYAACLQSFSMQWFGIPLPPAVLRREMSRYPTLADVFGGAVFQQCGLPYAPGTAGYPTPPQPPAIFGDICIVDGNRCVLAPIGGFPNPRPAVGNIIAETIGGTAPTVTVVTGVLQGGQAFSLVDVDGAVLNLGTVRRRAGNTGQAFGPALFYPLTGGTTDIQLQRTERTSPTSITNLVLRASSRVSTNTPVVELVYFYNFQQQRWVVVGSTVLTNAPPAAPVDFNPGAFGPLGDFLTAGPTGGATMYARVYTCALTQGAYSVLHDQLVFVPAIDIFSP